MKPFMKRYMAEREELYKVADHIIDTDGLTPESVVVKVVRIAREELDAKAEVGTERRDAQ